MRKQGCSCIEDAIDDDRESEAAAGGRSMTRRPGQRQTDEQAGRGRAKHGHDAGTELFLRDYGREQTGRLVGR